KRLNSSVITCDKEEGEWTPSMTTPNSIQCFFDGSREPVQTPQPLKWKDLRFYVWGFIILCLIAVSILLCFIYRRMRKAHFLKYPVRLKNA
ncbi:hypothetical protein PMAYCL1PPCAC_17559, partial [Pristionchus mayeri]